MNLPAGDFEGDPRIVGAATDMGADEVDEINPGSGDDLDLLTSVNGQGPTDATCKRATTGDTLTVDLVSSGGTYVGTIPILAAQLRTPFEVNPSTPGFPELHLALFGVIHLLHDGSDDSGLLGPSLLGPGGLSFVYGLPAGLIGQVIRIQGFALTPSAQNGFFVATNAHDIVME